MKNFAALFQENTSYPSTSKIKLDRFLRRLAENYRVDKMEAKSELDRLLKEYYNKNKRRSSLLPHKSDR